MARRTSMEPTRKAIGRVGVAGALGSEVDSIGWAYIPKSTGAVWFNERTQAIASTRYSILLNVAESPTRFPSNRAPMGEAGDTAK